MMKKVEKTENSLPPVRIEKLVHGGAGLGFADRPVFIPLTAPGDLVVPAGVRRARGVYFAEPGEILEPSIARTDPPCPWFGECGGCQWMHMGYTDQMRWKENVVREVFRRTGKIEVAMFDRVHPSPFEFGYRYRARVQIEGKSVGFFRRRSNTVVAWDRCLLLPDRINSIIPVLRSLLADGILPVQLQSLEVALSPVDESLTLNWSLGKDSFPGQRLSTVAERVRDKLHDGGFKILGQAFPGAGDGEPVVQGGALDLKVGTATLKASPGVFFQVNPWTNGILVERVLDRLKESVAGTLLDLFCGNGNFSIPAASAGFEIEGVDSNHVGIRDAMAVSADRCRFRAQDVGSFLDDRNGLWDAVLVDPPRAGLTDRIIKKLIALNVSVLIYVSCEPATLARDLALLVKGGYVIKNTELFDMFPQTPHAEVMVMLERG